MSTSNATHLLINISFNHLQLFTLVQLIFILTQCFLQLVLQALLSRFHPKNLILVLRHFKPQIFVFFKKGVSYQSYESDVFLILLYLIKGVLEFLYEIR